MSRNPLITPTLEKFFIDLPAGTLRKSSYAWFGVVVIYPWSRTVAALLGAVLLLCLVLLYLHNYSWEQRELREAQKGEDEPYIDRPRVTVITQIRNLGLAMALSGAVAYLLGGQLGLSRLQWFLIFGGFFLLQMDRRLLGAGVVYILSNAGLSIRWSDIKVFIHFYEIRSVTRVSGIKKPSPRWVLLTPSQSVSEGLLLIPSDREGFTRLLDHILLAPADQQSFLERLPPRIKIEELRVDE
jgi:hypothetical protein